MTLVPIHHLTVEQYRKMCEMGVVDEDDKVELLEGVVTKKPRKTPARIFSMGKTIRLLLRILPLGWFVDSQQPIDTADSEPEPDFSIIRGDIEAYTERIPTAHDVGLVIEVSDLNSQRNRRTKLKIYGRASMPFYWIINVDERTIEVYTEPFADSVSAGYGRRVVYAADGVIPLILDGVEVAQIAAADMLP